MGPCVTWRSSTLRTPRATPWRPGWGPIATTCPRGTAISVPASREPFDWGFAKGWTRVIVAGSDVPGLDGETIRAADRALDEHDVVIAPSPDGGYSLIGLRREIPDLFQEIPWSTDEVLGRTMEVAVDRGLSVRRLPSLADVDTFEDLTRLVQGDADQLARTAPRTAEVLRVAMKRHGGVTRSLHASGRVSWLGRLIRELRRSRSSRRRGWCGIERNASIRLDPGRGDAPAGRADRHRLPLDGIVSFDLLADQHQVAYPLTGHVGADPLRHDLCAARSAPDHTGWRPVARGGTRVRAPLGGGCVAGRGEPRLVSRVPRRAPSGARVPGAVRSPQEGEDPLGRRDERVRRVPVDPVCAVDPAVSVRRGQLRRRSLEDALPGLCAGDPDRHGACRDHRGATRQFPDTRRIRALRRLSRALRAPDHGAGVVQAVEATARRRGQGRLDAFA